MQADPFAAGVPSAHGVRIPGADRHIYNSNENDVVREMNTFLSKLPGRMRSGHLLIRFQYSNSNTILPGSTSDMYQVLSSSSRSVHLGNCLLPR